MRVTLDTAILVRANGRARGPARELFVRIQSGAAVLVLSRFLVQELDRVLRYPRVLRLYGMSDAETQQYVRDVELVGQLVTPFEGRRIVIKDRADDPVILTALAGKADILCTLDRHFYTPDVLSFCSRYGIRVMTDLELLGLLRAEQ